MKTQLGFGESIKSAEQWKYLSHRSSVWSDWDGGQIGGRPCWLNPHDLPANFLVCAVCGTEMHFLCQFYAPLEGAAFHRSFYLFGCPHMAECGSNNNNNYNGNDNMTNPTNHHPSCCVRVLRTQLPRDNPYWPVVVNCEKDDKDHPELAVVEQYTAENDCTTKDVCVYCGFPAKGKCPLQRKFFCGPQHQRLFKKYSNTCESNDTDDTGSPNETWKREIKSTLPGVYNISEIVVEEEPPLPTVVELNDYNEASAMFPSNDIENDSDEDIDQEDLNKIVTGCDKQKRKREDPCYQSFVQRCTERPNCKDQVLRYNRWPSPNDTEDFGPLWIRSDHKPNDIPPCPYCGADRRYEFQLMPQLLHYLTNDQVVKTNNEKPRNYDSVKAAVQHTDSLVQDTPPEYVSPHLVDAKNAAVQRIRNQLMNGSTTKLDWGVVVVYTCTNSCNSDIDSNLGAYREEYAWCQPAIDGLV